MSASAGATDEATRPSDPRGVPRAAVAVKRARAWPRGSPCPARPRRPVSQSLTPEAGRAEATTMRLQRPQRRVRLRRLARLATFAIHPTRLIRRTSPKPASRWPSTRTASAT